MGRQVGTERGLCTLHRQSDSGDGGADQRSWWAAVWQWCGARQARQASTLPAGSVSEVLTAQQRTQGGCSGGDGGSPARRLCAGCRNLPPDQLPVAAKATAAHGLTSEGCHTCCAVALARGLRSVVLLQRGSARQEVRAAGMMPQPQWQCMRVLNWGCYELCWCAQEPQKARDWIFLVFVQCPQRVCLFVLFFPASTARGGYGIVCRLCSPGIAHWGQPLLQSLYHKDHLTHFDVMCGSGAGAGHLMAAPL
mmetsp:Transcript_4524/g.11183  ORF Transcript_4524/g.11183 Transcript_4524/m.11183 type:complete len:251 (-) Transcript_4524:317-1069(-)